MKEWKTRAPVLNFSVWHCVFGIREAVMATEVKPGARIQESCTTIMGTVINNNTMSMSGSSRGLILSKPWLTLLPVPLCLPSIFIGKEIYNAIS